MQVVMTTIGYDAEVRHDGRLYSFRVENLEIPVCQACGAKVFTEGVDAQINTALRSHLHLLTPAEMRAALRRINIAQKDAAERLGVAEATISRWLTDTQIQSRAMDNLLRLYFAFPEVRISLSGDSQDPCLGVAELPALSRRRSTIAGAKGSKQSRASWLDAWVGKRGLCQQVQDVIERTGSTWGLKRIA
ncbi:MAG TPA: hypothetical protein VG055_00050 [Planctomycetaceae bacterium]|jgi:transcriptional regulator with XRE-family HTH domain|nr:hypothetical protein [Planctomycetaceae bacterium]